MKYATVKAHATLPDGENFQRVAGIPAGFVEQHVADSPAEDDAEYAPKEQVFHVACRPRRGLGDAGVKLVFEPLVGQCVEQGEGGQGLPAVLRGSAMY